VQANYTLLVPEREPPPAGEIFIGAGISRARQAFPGDTLSFRNSRGEPALFLVSGLLPVDSELLSADLILVCAADFRDFFGLDPGLATDFALRVGDIREQEAIASAISRQLPDSRPILQEGIRRTYASLCDWRSGITAVLLAGAALAFVILIWEKASGLSAEEKREIGILKAVGWETADVLLLKFWEGTVLALSSFLAGFILAYFHVFWGQAGLFEPALKGWAVVYPRFRLTPFFDPCQVSTLFLLTVLPYVAATVLPSWGPATDDPDRGMRG
jgi:ABC-type lipoprotein release transport system permease subunit